jgi:hypothetical protein
LFLPSLLDRCDAILIEGDGTITEGMKTEIDFVQKKNRAGGSVMIFLGMTAFRSYLQEQMLSMSSKNTETSTVKEAVLRILIEKYPVVKNHLIEKAHPVHRMSGMQRLRELKKEGIVQYTFERKTNRYVILTPLWMLQEALQKMTKEAV